MYRLFNLFNDWRIELFKRRMDVFMIHLLVASVNFGVAVWVIDSSIEGVAINVALGVLNFGMAIRERNAK